MPRYSMVWVEKAGWVGRTRTCTLLYQKQVHYHYATTHQRGSDTLEATVFQALKLKKYELRT